MTKKNWHAVDQHEALEALTVTKEQGLSEQKVEKRRERFGWNKLPEKKGSSSLKIIFEQFISPLILVLVIATVVSFAFKKFQDGLFILAAVVFNTLVGFFQEKKASNILLELKKALKSETIVIREGNKKKILQEELVPGDIIVLQAGEKVPADARIIEAQNLRISQAVLTGEWLAQGKTAEKISIKTALADRKNMAYLGTIIETGQGLAVVVGTGTDTETGKVAQMAEGVQEKKTPYQKKLIRFSRLLGIILPLLCVGIFFVGVLSGRDLIEMLEIAIAAAVASVPEGLPITMTVILALGMQRVLKKQGLIRKLSSVETLGSTSIVATDKTLTLTQGKMEIERVESLNQELTLKVAVLCAQGFVENPDKPYSEWKVRGSGTDRGIIVSGAQRGLEKQALENEFEKIEELPFNNERKMTVSLREGAVESNNRGKNSLCFFGAPEKLLELSQVKNKKEWEEKLETLTAGGLRVIAAAYKEVDSDYENLENLLGPEASIKGLNFLGLIGLKDPLREHVKEAIDTCRQAGMRPIIVTGDHLLTAKVVGKKLGFKIKKENVILGDELDELSDQEFREVLDKIDIYARTEPRHKLRIIKAWQEKKEVVAMTGDGINDAPALKKADVGVALGSGTEIAKQASDLILLADDFSTIVQAVKEGRVVLDNIRKVTTYLLSDSLTEILLIAISIALGIPLPVTALQILWVNLIEDGMPGMSLAFEPEEEDVMKREPEPRKTPLLTSEMKALMFIVGIIDDLTLVLVFLWLFKGGGVLPELRSTLIHNRELLTYVRTVVFSALATDTIFVIFACKSLRKNIWEMRLLNNKLLLLSVFVAFVFLLGAIYFPPFQRLLGTVPLTFYDWGLILTISVLAMVMIEITKRIFIVKKYKNAEKQRAVLAA